MSGAYSGDPGAVRTVHQSGDICGRRGIWRRRGLRVSKEVRMTKLLDGRQWRSHPSGGFEYAPGCRGSRRSPTETIQRPGDGEARQQISEVPHPTASSDRHHSARISPTSPSAPHPSGKGVQAARQKLRRETRRRLADNPNARRRTQPAHDRGWGGRDRRQRRDVDTDVGSVRCRAGEDATRPQPCSQMRQRQRRPRERCR